MRIRLSYKIFLAFLLTSFAIVVLTMGVLRFFVHRNFSDYLHGVEVEKTSPLVEVLGREYEKHQGWGWLKSKRRLWWKIVHAVLSGEEFENIVAISALDRIPNPESGKSGYGADHSPPKGETLNTGPRLFVLDEAKEKVAGRPGTDGKHTLREIRAGDRVVGWLGLRKREPLETALEVAFLKKQYKLFYLIGTGLLALTALVTFFLSRHLLSPIKQLTDGTQAMTSRKFQTRIDVYSRDELGQLAADFNNMASTLEKYEQMRQQWISDISHELRTPLAILRGEIEALQDGVREMNHETLDSLHAEVVRVSKIVDDLHKLSLADAEALPFKREQVNPLKVLTETIRSFETRLDQQKIRVHMDPEYQDVCVMGDEDRLKELFSNLLENTLRYGDSPGTLMIRQQRRGDKLTLRLEDSGPGVPEESLGRLFDRLYRVDKSRSRELGGSGLGLSICKSIVEAHGGEIRAENGLSGGLSIEIDFPLA